MIRYCDECKNFPQGDEWNIEEVHQKCRAGVMMKFVDPKNPLDLEWGFQKRDCKKFEGVE